jgi:hypothetical protein
MSDPDQAPITVTLAWDEVMSVQMGQALILQTATGSDAASALTRQVAQRVLGKLEPNEP